MYSISAISGPSEDIFLRKASYMLFSYICVKYVFSMSAISGLSKDMIL